MKRIAIILLASLGLLACKSTNEQQVSGENTSVQHQETAGLPSPDATIPVGNVLCQINGKDWSYTKASGIVSKHARTGERTALITFTKKLDKGKESIQLRYDASTFNLKAVSLILKMPKKGGGHLTSYYDLHPDTRERYPETEISGSIDLSDPSRASGMAAIKHLNIRYEKEKLLNSEDAVLNITGLRYQNIGYSDLDKFSKSLNK